MRKGYYSGSLDRISREVIQEHPKNENVILKVILKVIKLKKNLLVRKMEAARGMLKQPKSRSETERLIMKMAVVFLTWKMIKILLLLIMTMIMMRLKNMVIIVVMMKRRGCGE